MYANNVQFISNIIPLSIPAEPRPGERVTYTRDGRILSGTVWGTITTAVRRFKVDGKHPVVVEYIVEADAGQSNLRFHTVYEGDVVWSNGKVDLCPRCNGIGHIAIQNGCDDVPCPVCGDRGELVY